MKDTLQNHSYFKVSDTLMLPVRDGSVAEQTDSVSGLYGNSLFPRSPYEHPEVDFRYSGMAVEPMPYLLRNDDGVTVTLLCCFLMIMMIFARSKKYIKQQVQDFFFNRTNRNSRSTVTGREMRHTLFLYLQTGLLVALFAFNYTLSVCDMFMASVSHFQLLAVYVVCCWAFLGIKQLLYSAVNGVFFDKEERGQWMKSYSFLISMEGVLLFPFALVMVYFNLSVDCVMWCLGIVVGMIKLLLLYKTFNIFLPNFYGILHLIVYLCALEILPACALWKALMLTNSILL